MSERMTVGEAQAKGFFGKLPPEIGGHSKAVLDALTEYNKAHSRWMDTLVFTPEGQEAKRLLALARERYIAAVKAAHPSWIVM